MRHATRRSRQLPNQTQIHRRLREGMMILITAISLFLLLALLTYHNTDPGWSNTGEASLVANAGGRVGAWLSDFMLYLFGYMAYVFPFLLAYYGILLLKKPEEGQSNTASSLGIVLRFVGFVILMLSGTTLASLQFGSYHAHLPYTAGGILGDVLAPMLVQEFNIAGSALTLIALLCIGITLLSGLSWPWLLDLVGRAGVAVMKKIFALFSRKKSVESDEANIAETKAPKSLSRYERMSETKSQKVEPVIESIKETQKGRRLEPIFANFSAEDEDEDDFAFQPERSIPSSTRKNAALNRNMQSLSDDVAVRNPEPAKTRAPNPIVVNAPVAPSKSYATKPSLPGLPPISLLDPPEPRVTGRGYSPAKLEEMSREVEARLHDFGIEVQVVAVHPGPVITRFEMQLAPGIKVSRISALAKDLARSLSVTSVRIVEVIPGKSFVGLELPNNDREMVRLCEILNSPQYEQMRSPLALTLGKDISGHPVVVDLAKMPHLLVAGTTGSGKSVGLNAMLLGLLYKATPEELRMILVDPKMLELSVYEGIPHLLTPVVTDMKEAANGLRWCVAEMERRYRLMAGLGVRNLAGFNAKISEANKKGTPINDPTWRGIADQICPTLNPLPFIVVVIDEYADMMMVVGKKVEQLIARIAQKARAAGIHLILATQRPSVDVITGLIKANIPTRIAFQVSSKIDSRTVLDQGGAEQLLGNGDMLYLPPGTSVPVRVHGAYVADHEVHKVVADWQTRGSPDYIEEILRGGAVTAGDGSGDEGEVDSNSEQDPLFDEAVHIITLTRRASISSLQRRMKIGYNRAARMIEAMEAAGIVGAMESNGNREVLAPQPPED